jgi:hypothetical protein
MRSTQTGRTVPVLNVAHQGRSHRSEVDLTTCRVSLAAARIGGGEKHLSLGITPDGA